MSEDYTYTAEPTRAQLAARVQELERKNAELRARLDAVGVDDRVEKQELLSLLATCTPSAELSLMAMDAIEGLLDKNDAMRARIAAFPNYVRYLGRWHAGDGLVLDFDEWYAKRAQPADDTDAPLKLAALDEDGDE